MGKVSHIYLRTHAASGRAATRTGQAQARNLYPLITLGDVITPAALRTRERRGIVTGKPHLQLQGSWWRCIGPDIYAYGRTPQQAYSSYTRWNNLAILARGYAK